jgi:ribonuclease HI
LNQVTLITDGSGWIGDTRGGWACILRTEIGGKVIEKELSGQVTIDVTSQRMELTALLRGLESLKQSCAVTVVSDSEYLVKGLNTWTGQWAAKGWKTKGHKPVANMDLWRQILELKKMHHVTATWVRGHAGHDDNERCDFLAKQARLSAV